MLAEAEGVIPLILLWQHRDNWCLFLNPVKGVAITSIYERLVDHVGPSRSRLSALNGSSGPTVHDMVIACRLAARSAASRPDTGYPLEGSPGAECRLSKRVVGP